MLHAVVTPPAVRNSTLARLRFHAGVSVKIYQPCDLLIRAPCPRICRDSLWYVDVGQLMSLVQLTLLWPSFTLSESLKTVSAMNLLHRSSFPYKSDSVMSRTVSQVSKPSSMKLFRYCARPSRDRIGSSSVMYTTRFWSTMYSTFPAQFGSNLGCLGL